MPGMMDIMLKLGLNDEVVIGLATKSGERFAYDSYRRFLDMIGNVVSCALSRLLILFPEKSKMQLTISSTWPYFLSH